MWCHICKVPWGVPKKVDNKYVHIVRGICIAASEVWFAAQPIQFWMEGTQVGFEYHLCAVV